MGPRRKVEQNVAFALVAGLAAGIGACGAHGADLGFPGASDKGAEAPHHAPSSSAAKVETWPLATDVASFPAIDDRELPSGHNAPYWSSTVRVNPALDPVYRALGPATPIPTGAVAVALHRGSDGANGPRYAMVKHEPGYDADGGDWEYLVVEDDGKIAQAGALPLCARCHGDAPNDHLFGPRVATRKRLSGSTSGDAATPAMPEEDEARAPEGDAAGTSSTSKTPKTRGKKKHLRALTQISESTR